MASLVDACLVFLVDGDAPSLVQHAEAGAHDVTLCRCATRVCAPSMLHFAAAQRVSVRRRAPRFSLTLHWLSPPPAAATEDAPAASVNAALKGFLTFFKASVEPDSRIV